MQARLTGQSQPAGINAQYVFGAADDSDVEILAVKEEDVKEELDARGAGFGGELHLAIDHVFRETTDEEYFDTQEQLASAFEALTGMMESFGLPVPKEEERIETLRSATLWLAVEGQISLEAFRGWFLEYCGKERGLEGTEDGMDHDSSILESQHEEEGGHSTVGSAHQRRGRGKVNAQTNRNPNPNLNWLARPTHRRSLRSAPRWRIGEGLRWYTMAQRSLAPPWGS